MDLKINTSEIEKIVVRKKNTNAFIIYHLKNGYIDDIEILDKPKTTKEKDVKKISKLMDFDEANILDHMARTNFDMIKDNIISNPIDNKIIESSKIMKLNGKMDEAAKDFREVIAKKTFSENSDDELNVNIDKALTIGDREERIKFLKDAIAKSNKNNGKGE